MRPLLVNYADDMDKSISEEGQTDGPVEALPESGIVQVKKLSGCCDKSGETTFKPLENNQASQQGEEEQKVDILMQKKLSFKSQNFTNNMSFTEKLRQQACDESMALRTRQRFEQERA